MNKSAQVLQPLLFKTCNGKQERLKRASGSFRLPPFPPNENASSPTICIETQLFFDELGYNSTLNETTICQIDHHAKRFSNGQLNGNCQGVDVLYRQPPGAAA